MLLLAACPGTRPLPSRAPDIVGTITRRGEADGSVSLLVIQDSTRSAGYPGAQVTVARGMRVVRRSDGRAVSAGDLRVGTRVEIWFTGAIRDSLPVQATAAAITILP
jgi:hypothetical protein